jgi:hypothetical protein
MAENGNQDLAQMLEEGEEQHEHENPPPPAGAVAAPDVDGLAAAAAGLQLDGNAEADAAQARQIRFWYGLAQPNTNLTFEMFEIMYKHDTDQACEFVQAQMAQSRPSNDSVAAKSFDAAKVLSKASPNGQLQTGDKAKDNPKDILAWLAACKLWLVLQGVPQALMFCIAFFCCLSADARAMVFPQLKDCSDPEQLMDGSWTWAHFSNGVLGSALGGRQETDLQLFYECLSVHSDVHKPDTMGTVAKLESIWSRMQQQFCDLIKICFVHRAVHSKLKDLIAYTEDMKPWVCFADFRANLVNHATPFD